MMLLAVPGPVATASAGQAQGVQEKPVWYSTGISTPPQSDQVPNAGKIFKVPQQFCVLVRPFKTFCMLHPNLLVTVECNRVHVCHSSMRLDLAGGGACYKIVSQDCVCLQPGRFRSCSSSLRVRTPGGHQLLLQLVHTQRENVGARELRTLAFSDTITGTWSLSMQISILRLTQHEMYRV